jgi:hypothetical protein
VQGRKNAHAREVGVWAAAAFATTSAPAITVRERAASQIGRNCDSVGRVGAILRHRSLFDPWHECEVLEMHDAQYLGGYNSPTMGTGAVLKKYRARDRRPQSGQRREALAGRFLGTGVGDAWKT